MKRNLALDGIGLYAILTVFRSMPSSVIVGNFMTEANEAGCILCL